MTGIYLWVVEKSWLLNFHIRLIREMQLFANTLQKIMNKDKVIRDRKSTEILASTKEKIMNRCKEAQAHIESDLYVYKKRFLLFVHVNNTVVWVVFAPFVAETNTKSSQWRDLGNYSYNYKVLRNLTVLIWKMSSRKFNKKFPYLTMNRWIWSIQKFPEKVEGWNAYSPEAFQRYFCSSWNLRELP